MLKFCSECKYVVKGFSTLQCGHTLVKSPALYERTLIYFYNCGREGRLWKEGVT